MKSWKKRLISSIFVLTVAASISTMGVSAAGWHKTNGKWWYEKPDGTYWKNGIHYVGDAPYYFDKNGYLPATWYQNSSGSWCYQDANGNLASGWKKINGNWYHFSSYGRMDTGFFDENGKSYFLKPDGQMCVGWYLHNGGWCYYGADGDRWRNGFKEIGGKTYYLNSFGTMQVGLQKIGGKYHFFHQSNGDMQTGWIDSVSGNRMFADENGVLATDIVTIDGHNYRFSDKAVFLGEVEEWVPQKPEKYNGDPSSIDYRDLSLNLNIKFGWIQTPLGDYSFDIQVVPSLSKMFPEDFKIKIDWSGMLPTDIEYASEADKQETVRLLKKMQKDIYEEVISQYPGLKLSGCFLHGYYKYPHIKVDYRITQFLTWKNYSGDITTPYNQARAGAFRWDNSIDDYKW